MKGLEKIYYEIDGTRKRLVRLVAMNRVEEAVALPIMTKILHLLEDINTVIEKGEEVTYGSDEDTAELPKDMEVESLEKRPGGH